MTKKKIKYGKVNLPPDTFDPKNGFICLDIYDRVKTERDFYETALKWIARDYPATAGILAETALKIGKKNEKI